MVEVQVEYDYNAKEPDELTIKRGDVITDVVKKPGGWWEGVLNDKKGLFPDNFVKPLEKDSQVVLRHKKDSNVKSRRCRVLFSYDPDHEDELSIKVDDVIDVLGEEEEGWWRGVLNGVEGVFPSNFVEEIKPSSKPRPTSRDDIISSLAGEINSRLPVLPAKPQKLLCEVKYSYKAQNEDELTLKEGDVLTLLSKDGQDIGWWKGELNGKVGVFPDNFVAVLPIEDGKAAPPNIITAAPLKPSSIVSQRKSLENKANADSNKENDSNKTTPPVPGKKPSISLKKSPSGSGIISGIKKKIADVVDGAGISKSSSKMEGAPENNGEPHNPDNAFDQVERRPLLSDVRATRAKGPGRRPPSTLLKDFEFVEDAKEPPEAETEPEVNGGADAKPALREWEKHKAPWLEEMKLNQAKRTSTSPGPEHKLKLTPTDIEEHAPNKTDKETSSPVEMSKSMPVALAKAKTPPNELEKSVALRPKPKVPLPARPQTIQVPESAPKSVHVSPVVTNRSPSPMMQKPPHDKVVNNNAKGEFVSYKEYSEVVERLRKLETALREQSEAFSGKIEELGNKLQVESDLRKMLQLEVDKFTQTALN